MLRTSQHNKVISAYEEMDRAFDRNRTPLTPLGCKLVVYQDPNEQASWAPHPCNAFYIGRTPLDYRLKNYWTTNTHCFSHVVGKMVPNTLRNAIHFGSGSNGHHNDQSCQVHARHRPSNSIHEATAHHSHLSTYLYPPQ